MNQTCSNCYQLAADNQRLRESLGNCVSAARSYRSDLLRLDANTNFNSSEMKQCGLTADDSHVDEMRDPKLKAARTALAATPADALEAYRHKVLEEAANAVRKECEVYSEFQNENAVLMAAAEVIRRMAGETVAKTVAKEDDSKGFEGVTQ